MSSHLPEVPFCQSQVPPEVVGMPPDSNGSAGVPVTEVPPEDIGEQPQVHLLQQCNNTQEHAVSVAKSCDMTAWSLSITCSALDALLPSRYEECRAPYCTFSSDNQFTSQGLLETWMLLEFADRGSLEQAIQQKRFLRKPDQHLDMVRCCSTCLCYTAAERSIPQFCIDERALGVEIRLERTLADFLLDLWSFTICANECGTVPHVALAKSYSAILAFAKPCVIAYLQASVYKSLVDVATGMQVCKHTFARCPPHLCICASVHPGMDKTNC